MRHALGQGSLNFTDVRGFVLALLMLALAAAAQAADSSHGVPLPPAPTLSIQSITPARGDVAGGTPVTIAGTLLKEVNVIYFGTEVTTDFTTNADGTVLYTATPAGADVGLVDVMVTSRTAAATLPNAFEYFDSAPPAGISVQSITPSSGDVAGGTPVTITGTLLREVTDVLFGSVNGTNISVNSDGTVLYVDTPQASVSGLVDVTLVNDVADVIVRHGFEYRDPAAPSTDPAIQSVTPSTGRLSGGELVTIWGVNMDAVESVAFGLVQAVLVGLDSAWIQVTVPAGAAPGPVDVSLIGTRNRIFDTLRDGYTYTGPRVTVSAIAPDVGPLDGGNIVKFEGTNLTSVTRVTFAGIDATPASLSLSDDERSFAVPRSQNPGAVDVEIFTAYSSLMLPQAYTYIAPPTISSVTPSNGPMTGGTPVVISGDELIGIASVRFGSKPAASFTVVDTHTIEAVTPAVTMPGSITVELTLTNGGAASLAHGFTFDNVPSTVSAIAPDAGPLAGGIPVTITGTRLNSVSMVLVGGNFATVQPGGTATQFDIILPVSTVSGSVDVTVTTNYGNTTVTGGFTYLAPVLPSLPTITRVAPAAGPLSGGNTVKIYGTDLDSVHKIAFGTVEVLPVAALSPGVTELDITVPAGLAAGAVDVSILGVSRGAQQNVFDTLPAGYTYLFAPTIPPAPTLTHAIPGFGPLAGGNLVTLFGDNLSGASTVTFGGTPGTGLSVVSATSVSVMAPAGLALGAVDVTVTTPGGTFTLPQGYSYSDPPVSTGPSVTEILPNSGPAGTAVTMRGVNLSGIQYAVFGDEGVSVRVTSDTEIRVTAPQTDVLGPVRVEIGSITSSYAIPDGFTYTEAPAPDPADNNKDAAFGGASSSCIQSVGVGTPSAPFAMLLLAGGLAAAWRARRRASRRRASRRRA